ncbi:phosphatidate phosphatase PAH2-like isoform X2 [Chenopodium quinoa]|uniref:phosphatidate phosphatase PAH2-like isoform X2 n=1 Tax=Chenopodium quinoa TaxID=63459 RepID=UPI000B79A078|nr:phosphatidate phosphatase PAH2-like isoform X2 [Chenopodium quinoa]
MFAVGRLGSYISRGVCTVSGPFHPFGGAVDVIVVEQQDGSFKSTPWYVRFGKFQGVLKATERVVSINVNGVDADFHMYLDHKGEAFFVKEVDGAEAESESYYSSPDEKEVNSDSWITQKSMSCNYDANRTEMISELEGSNGKITARTNSSRRGRIFRLPFGRRLMKENGFRDGNSSAEVDSVSSLERAEIAADLLEVRWTTNLRPGKNQTTSVSNATKKPSSVSSEGNVTSADLTSVGSNISDGVHDGCSKNNQISVSEFSEVSKSSPKLAQTVASEIVEGNVSPEWSFNNINVKQENIGKCNGDEDTLWNASTSHVTDVVGTSHQCSIGEVPLEYSSSGDPCKSATGSMNELSSEDLYAGTSGLNSLPIVSEKEGSVTNVTQCALSSSPKDPTRDRINEVTPSDDKEEQFLFSDLDDCKVEKVEHIQTSSSGSSLESSEGGLPKRTFTDESHHLTCNPAQDNLLINDASLKMNSNRMSCPISISKVHDDDAEEKALAPAAESLPIMVFDGDDPSRDARQTISRSLDSTLEAFKMVNNDVSAASGLSGGPQQVAQSRLEEIKNIISDPAVEVSLCRHLLFDGMGYEAAAQAFDAEKLDIDNFLSLGLDILKNDKLVVRIGGLYFPWDAALPIASAIGSQEKVPMLEPKGMIAVGQVENQSSEGVTQKSINSGNGSWRLWPFSFKKSNSMQNRNSSFETPAEDLKDIAGNSDAVVPRAMKKKIRAKFPTSEQLASLNLKEGKNVVTFTFSTAMLGEQKVEARIFLWKWNARIVVSDVDGTITKSDVLGQFMPMMGIDWSQTGVTHLFSAIKENGYQLLFLSARSISQAYHTRQFLFNLKQDGKALPEGPVLISPDGLFPSLYREVIRRAPHEFKIACLEDVKVLFPLDHNPFYAGFGNRDTDELSYLRVGMPRGKIFTINPKGQVVVNRRVDSKSYTSLHVLVHDMFPPTTFHEQEDYNSWNFWKLPPRDAI